MDAGLLTLNFSETILLSSANFSDVNLHVRVHGYPLQSPAPASGAG
jgi:hypothetical protein